MAATQLDLPGTESVATPRAQGYIAQRRRPGVPARAITSLEMTLEERELLGKVAEAEGVSLAEVLRRGLALYVAQLHELGAEEATTNG